MAVHTRTIGTGCNVLRRDVGTSNQLSVATVGTEPLSPGITRLINNETNTDLSNSKHQHTSTVISCPNFSDRLVIEVPVKKTTTCDTGVQSSCRRSFTLDFGTQTDKWISKVPKMDASVQHSSSPPKIHHISVECQCNRTSPAKTAHFGVQVDTQIKGVLTHSTGVQVARNQISINALATQTEQKTELIKKKSFGAQFSPLCSDMGILAKIVACSNYTQTSITLKKDVGLNVNQLPPSPTKKNIGVNTENVVPSIASRLTDTLDLLKKTNVAVNTVKFSLVSTSTETKRLNDNSKENELLVDIKNKSSSKEKKKPKR